jgi:hypothetical protein
MKFDASKHLEVAFTYPEDPEGIYEGFLLGWSVKGSPPCPCAIVAVEDGVEGELYSVVLVWTEDLIIWKE